MLINGWVQSGVRYAPLLAYSSNGTPSVHMPYSPRWIKFDAYAQVKPANT